MTGISKKKAPAWATVAWVDESAQPDRRYNEGSWKLSDIPALLDSLRARGVKSVEINDKEQAL